MLVSDSSFASVAGEAAARREVGHAAKAGTKTSGAGAYISGMHVDAQRYTTRQRNAHRTGVERELLYPWHPWTGRQVHIHEVIEKGDAAVFRCSVSGQASDRWLQDFASVGLARCRTEAGSFIGRSSLPRPMVLSPVPSRG